MERLLYMDNAATTALDSQVLTEMMPYFQECYGNASSIYGLGATSKEAIDKARGLVAGVIGAKDGEIYFTSGGTESDNWALRQVFEAYSAKGKHIITSKIEHHAILHTCEYLEKHGAEVTYLDVDDQGMVCVEELSKAIRPDTILISIMFANNEIGTIQPIKEIGALARSRGILFHTDAVQAFGQIPISVEEMSIDLLSASAHKLHGPKGIGILFVRKGVKIRPFMIGGQQEKGKRGGTENVPSIVGMGAAAARASITMQERANREIVMRDYLIKGILSSVSHSRVNGHTSKRLPNNVNISFEFIEGESLLIMLDQRGICASSGSACTSGSLDPSHVLLAIGLKHEVAHGSLRLSIDDQLTYEDADYVIESVKQVVERLRMISPLYEDYLKNQKKEGL